MALILRKESTFLDEMNLGSDGEIDDWVDTALSGSRDFVKELLEIGEESLEFSAAEDELRKLQTKLNDAEIRESLLKQELQVKDKKISGLEDALDSLKKELLEERARARDEAEDMAQELAELRYQMSETLEEERMLRARTEQVSVHRVEELEHQVKLAREEAVVALARRRETELQAEKEIGELRGVLEATRLQLEDAQNTLNQQAACEACPVYMNEAECLKVKVSELSARVQEQEGELLVLKERLQNPTPELPEMEHAGSSEREASALSFEREAEASEVDALGVPAMAEIESVESTFEGGLENPSLVSGEEEENTTVEDMRADEEEELCLGTEHEEFDEVCVAAEETSAEEAGELLSHDSQVEGTPEVRAMAEDTVVVESPEEERDMADVIVVVTSEESPEAAAEEHGLTVELLPHESQLEQSRTEEAGELLSHDSQVEESLEVRAMADDTLVVTSEESPEEQRDLADDTLVVTPEESPEEQNEGTEAAKEHGLTAELLPHEESSESPCVDSEDQNEAEEEPGVDAGAEAEEITTSNAEEAITEEENALLNHDSRLKASSEVRDVAGLAFEEPLGEQMKAEENTDVEEEAGLATDGARIEAEEHQGADLYSAQMASLEQKIFQIQASEKHLQIERTDLLSEVTELKSQVEHFKLELELAMERHTAALVKLEGERATLQEEMEASKASLTGEISHLQETLQGKGLENESVRRELADYHSNLEKESDRAQELASRIKALESELHSERVLYSEAASKCVELSHALEVTTQKLAAIEVELEVSRSENEELQKALRGAENQLLESTREKHAVEEEVQRLRGQLGAQEQRSSRLQQEVVCQRSASNQLAGKVGELNAEVLMLQQRLITCQTQVSEMAMRNVILEDTVAAKKRKIKEGEQRMMKQAEVVGRQEEKYFGLQAKFSALQNDFAALEAKLSETRRREQEIRVQMERVSLELSMAKQEVVNSEVRLQKAVKHGKEEKSRHEELVSKHKQTEWFLNRKIEHLERSELEKEQLQQEIWRLRTSMSS